MRLSCIAAALTALVALMPPVRAAPPRPTFLGVVDDHGRLTPIAVYDGSAWWGRWPWDVGGSDKIRALQLPDSLAAIPADWLPPGLQLPLNWRAFADSKRLISFRALRPERAPETAMMDTVVITTTYRGPAVEAQNGGGDTVAVSGPGTPGKLVAPSRREEDAILRQLQSRIAALEADELARWKQEHRAESADAGAVPERVYVVDDAGALRLVSKVPTGYRDFGFVKAEVRSGAVTPYYLSGEKLFRVRPNDDCKLNVSVNGFVFVSASGNVTAEKIRVHAFGGFCGDPAEMFFPLNTITIGNRTWWIVKNTLEDGYDYGLVDPSTGEPAAIKGAS